MHQNYKESASLLRLCLVNRLVMCGDLFVEDITVIFSNVLKVKWIIVWLNIKTENKDVLVTGRYSIWKLHGWNPDWYVMFNCEIYLSLLYFHNRAIVRQLNALAARNIPISVDLETQAIRQLQFLKRVKYIFGIHIYWSVLYIALRSSGCLWLLVAKLKTSPLH